MNSMLTERVKKLKGIIPSADVFAGGVDSDVISMKGYKRIAFTIFSNGTGSAGVGTFTVKAASDVSKTGATALAFKHRKLGDGADETMSALTDIASTGVACVAGADEVHVIEVSAADLPDSLPFIYLSVAETVNAPIVGCVEVELFDPHYTSDQPVMTGLS